MVADDIGIGPVDRAKQAAAAEIFHNIRDRRLLKWLFPEDPENCGPIGHVDGPIDRDVQNEFVATIVDIAWKHFKQLPGRQC